MLKHIVLIKIKDNSDEKRKNSTDRLVTMLTLLTSSIDEISHLEVGRNISNRASAYDLCLSVEFVNEESLNTYRIHPDHVKVLDFMKTLDIETAVTDYFY